MRKCSRHYHNDKSGLIMKFRTATSATAQLVRWKVEQEASSGQKKRIVFNGCAKARATKNQDLHAASRLLH